MRPCVRPSGAFRASLREIFKMFAAISPIARDLSKIHARSGLGTRLVSLCTAFPALGVDSVRHAHDFRAMRFCLPIRLGMAITFALTSHSVRHTRHFRFMRFRPVRLQNGMEIVDCLVPFAPLFSARSRARRLRSPDDLGQLLHHDFDVFLDGPIFETFAPSFGNDHPVRDVREIASWIPRVGRR